MYFILFYDYVENILEKRIPHREAHLALATEYANRGEIILGGALANPADGAVIVFKLEDKTLVEAFVDKDPYVINGLVKKWHIREWTAVIGSAF